MWTTSWPLYVAISLKPLENSSEMDREEENGVPDLCLGTFDVLVGNMKLNHDVLMLLGKVLNSYQQIQIHDPSLS